MTIYYIEDYNFVSVSISKSINSVYTQLSAKFADTTCPEAGDLVKFYPYWDGIYTKVLFYGQVVSVNPTFRHVGGEAELTASSMERCLSTQKVPWRYQTVNLDTFINWNQWIETIFTSDTGLSARNIDDNEYPDKDFTFQPTASRYEVGKSISDYCGCLLKFWHSEVKGDKSITPYFSMVPAEDIDKAIGGFDLPDPITLAYPDNTLIDEIELSPDDEGTYNTVIVYGTLTSTGEIDVSVACTAEVYAGTEIAREYILEDTSLEEHDTTAEIESVKWLLYFSAPRATVNMKFAKRYDFELFQRLKFGTGYPQALQDLTSSTQLSSVYVYDPRDPDNTVTVIDTSGVPRPTWLRVSELKYDISHTKEVTQVTAITDYIYSSVDPVIASPYNVYLSPGYLKPSLDSLASQSKKIAIGVIHNQIT